MSTMRRRARTGAAVLGVVAVAVVSSVATTALAGGGGPFSDVGDDHPFADEIAFVADSGIAQGYEDGTFRPGAPVTRQAMAAFFARSQTYTYVQATQQVTDGTLQTVTATCPDGTVVVGGGVQSSVPLDGRVSRSAPDLVGNGWTGAVGVDEAADFEVTTTAICVPGQVSAS